MSYLLDFVKSLNEKELSQFRNLDLTGKEELIRDEYARHAFDNKFDETKLSAKYKITSSHVDKINSVVLDKTIYALFGNNYDMILLSILTRGLTHLMMHELKILERRVAKGASTGQRISFYKAAFENLRKMFHPNYSSKLTHTYGARYLQALGKRKTKSDESYVAMMGLCGDMISAHVSGKEKSFNPKAEKILAAVKGDMQKNAVTRFYYFFAMATYYKHLTEDADGFMNSNKEALQALQKSKNKVDEKYHSILLCELGFGNIILNKADVAQAYYQQAVEQFPEVTGRTTYHLGNYLVAATINGDYKTAQNIFDHYLIPKIQSGNNRSMLFDIYAMIAWVKIHERKFDQAFAWLNKIKDYKKGEITLIGFCKLRQLESACFLFSGDLKTAALTVDKNMRFMQKHIQHSPSVKYTLNYVDILGKLIKLEQGKLRLTEKLKQQISALPTGIYQFYNMPLIAKYSSLAQ